MAKRNQAAKREFSDRDYSQHYQLKKAGIERVLGPMHDMVGHAIIPFQVGGPVDMYRFPKAKEGTAFVTMELIEPDGSGPQPSRIGTYELVAFTKHRIDDSDSKNRFGETELRIRSIFTSVARYSYHAVLNPLETCEVPVGEDEPSQCLVFDEWKKRGIDFRIGQKKHGLLLCIEVFRSEMEFAMRHGAKALLERLKEKEYYPYSDLERLPVA
ncbi:suppressor of fused domain protein [Candidatus Amarolinea dominans]|uniref:suppressor of fused domain protein n=1 Tax=Candidatus Amarolinea dominans TaxID=3140696 RepID=UPI003136777D|nr:suppressor of fused domain protein [Anaerolineae bacterium]